MDQVDLQVNPPDTKGLLDNPLNILDMPADIIKVIFGRDNTVQDYDYSIPYFEEHHAEMYLVPVQLSNTLMVVVGQHTCKQLRDVLEWDEEPVRYVAELAAQANSLALVRWAVDYGYYPEEGSNITLAAAANGNLPILKWANARGYAITWKASEAAALAGHFGTFEWLDTGDCWADHGGKIHTAAVSGGNIDILEYMKDSDYYDSGFNDDSRDGNFMMKNAPIGALEWVYANGYSMRRCIGHDAVRANRLDVLKWLHKEYRPVFNQSTVYYTPQNIVHRGNLEMVKWFVAECGMSPARIFIAAIRNAKTDIREWAGSMCNYQSQSNWPTTLLSMSKMFMPHNLPVVVYLVKKGAEWPADALKRVVENDIALVQTFAPTQQMITEMLNLGCPRVNGLPQLYDNAGRPDSAMWLREQGLD